MTALIILFGALTLLAGIVLLVNPDILFGYLRTNVEELTVHVLAVVVRLVLGALYIVQAGASRFPLAIEIIGWISIVAAAVLALMGRRNFVRLMSWALSLSKPFNRYGGVVAAAFGAFVIYAFVA